MRHIRAFLVTILFAVLIFTGCGSRISDNMNTDREEAGKTQAVSGKEFKVHFIDAGQSDATLIESDGHFMLVDAGENDQGDRVVSYLKEQGVRSLDYVIGTHPHSDHIGGLDTVIKSLDVKKVILPKKEHTSRTFLDVLKAVKAKGLKITRPVPGDKHELGSASFTILAPNADYGDNLNDWSVGIRVENGNNHVVITGDAEADAEQDIINNIPELQADLWKAAHHGSSTSNSEALLKKISPKYAVISCGKNNQYGHPHRETLERFADMGVQVFRTDESGTIVAVGDGSDFTFSTKPSKAMAAGKKPQENKAEGKYILNTNTKKFHLEDCESADQIKEKNLGEFEGKREELIKKGYDPCKNCNP